MRSRLGSIGAPPRIAGSDKIGSMKSTAFESRVFAVRPVTACPFSEPGGDEHLVADGAAGRRAARHDAGERVGRHLRHRDDEPARLARGDPHHPPVAGERSGLERHHEDEPPPLDGAQAGHGVPEAEQLRPDQVEADGGGAQEDEGLDRDAEAAAPASAAPPASTRRRRGAHGRRCVPSASGRRSRPRRDAAAAPRRARARAGRAESGAAAAFRRLGLMLVLIAASPAPRAHARGGRPRPTSRSQGRRPPGTSRLGRSSAQHTARPARPQGTMAESRASAAASTPPRLRRAASLLRASSGGAG